MRRPLPAATILVATLMALTLTPGALQAQAAPPPKPSTTISGTAPGTPSMNPATSTAMPALGAEVVSKRTKNTKTFSTSKPGTFVTKIFSPPVHYLDAAGTWSNIDTSLVAAGGGRFQTAGTKDAAQVAASSTDPALGRLVLDATHSVGFALAGAAAVSATPKGNSITYPGILPFTDVTLHAGNAGLKEDIVLHSAAAPSVFVFPLVLQGLSASVAADGEVVLTDAAGGTQRAIIPQGYMSDSADPLHHVGAVSQGVTYTVVSTPGGASALKVTLDQAWLKDPARVYPVVVDPSTSDISTGEDDTYVMSNFTRDNAYDSVLKVGTYDGGANVGIAFMNFDLSSLNGMVINSATFYAYENYAWSCSGAPDGPVPGHPGMGRP